MKRLILLIAVVGCTQQPQIFASKEEAKLHQHRVKFLFENDGCKVWSFYDGPSVGDAVYVDCRGSVKFKKRRQVGKTVYYDDKQVVTGGDVE